MSSVLDFHSKLKLLLQNLNRSSNSVPLRQVLEAVEAAKAKNHLFGLLELLSIPRVGQKSIEKLLGVPLEPRVVNSVQHYQEYLHPLDAQSKLPESVVSIDVGLARSAYCLLTDDYEIKDWDLLEMPDCNSYDIRRNYLMFLEFTKRLPPADMFCIESQYHETSKNLGHISVKLKVIEMALYAALTNQSFNAGGVNPKRVSYYFEYDSYHLNKKRAAVWIAKLLLLEEQRTPLGNLVKTSDRILKVFQSHRKKDDLCDAMLQAVAVMEWKKMHEELVLMK